MNLGFIKDAVMRVQRFTVNHSPEILAAVGIGGFFTTTALAVKATPEAMNLIEEKKAEEQVDELTTVETVKAAWKPYVPAVITCAASTLCIVGSVSTSLKRTAALATAYEVSREFIDTYREKVIEAVGEKKEQKIHHETSQQLIDNHPPKADLYNNRPRGCYLYCFEPTNTYFWSTKTNVENAITACMNQERESPEQYVGVVDVLLELGAFEYMSQKDKDFVTNHWYGMGWSVAEQGKYVAFHLPETMKLDKARGEFIGVIEANIEPIDDYYIFGA